jgi:hypothetical protein
MLGNTLYAFLVFALTRTLVMALKRGAFDRYYGETFSISRADNPIVFTFFAAFMLLIILLFAWGLANNLIS